MKTIFKILVCLIFPFSLFFTLGGPPVSGESNPPDNKVPQGVENKAQQLMADLKKQGFEVSQGYFKLYTNDYCPYSFEVMHTCYGNNPAAPYVLFSVPPWPKEYVDPETIEACGPNKEGYITSYRFDPQEAIVIFGVLPPPAAYFGLQTYLFTTKDKFDTSSTPYQFFYNVYPNMLNKFFTKVPSNPKRLESFSSLSNSINNVVIERKSETAFNQQRFFIVTPDQNMDKIVRKALNKISVEDKDIFTEAIPSNLRIGLDKSADDFLTVIRYVKPEDGGGEGSLSDKWRKDPPLVVLRVRDTRDGQTAEPYPQVVLETRTGEDESYLKPDLLNLVKAVSERWGQPCTDTECKDKAGGLFILELPPINMVGPKCTEIGMNCQADSEDTSYQYSKDVFLNDDVVFAVAGTLGTQTDNATYVGLGLMASMRQLGFDNLFDEDLMDTASKYASVVNNTEKFFLYYFARNCKGLGDLTDGNCREISKEVLPDCDDPTSKTCDNLKFSLRDYIRLDTQRGPDPFYKLPSMVITLSRPSGIEINLPLVVR